MKRIASFIICASLVLNLASVTVFAKEGDSARLEAVLNMIKPRIPDTSGFTEFDSGIQTEDGTALYSFSWSNSSGKNMYVTATESGIIVQYGFYETIRNEAPIPGFDRISTEEAVKRTAALVDALNPSLVGKLEIEESGYTADFYSNRIYLNVVHKENGISVRGDTGRVAVDINAERILSFRINYTENLKYESTDRIISETEAKRAFEEKLGLSLSYRIYKNRLNRSVKVFPAYTAENKNTYIDALSGNAVLAETYLNFFGSVNDMASSSAGGADYKLSDAELKALENISGILTEAESVELLRSDKLLGITSEYKVIESSLRKDAYSDSSYIRAIVFASEEASIYVEINAASGEILEYLNFRDEAAEKKLPKEKLKAAADKAFELLAPEKYGEYVANETEDDENGCFTYTRYVNGVLVSGDTATVELKTSDASLEAYRINYTNADFPSVASVLEHKTVCERYFENTQYEPEYIPQKSDESLKNTDIAILVYAETDENVIIDAFSGNRINLNGTAYTDDGYYGEYTDIEGHYAEKEISALKRFQIGFEGKEFKPDALISQSEFIELANSAGLGSLSISDLKTPPANTLTRIEAARLICCVLEIEKYAAIEEIYNCRFDDVTEGKGYVSVLWGLGIINGTAKDKFSPNDGLTRAQAAILIYNTMESYL